MAMMEASHVEAAANYLLKLLFQEGKVPYERFYDGEEETAEKLATGIGMSPEDAEWYSAEHIMDLAAATLEEQGFVKINWLNGTLADGEPAYEIELLPNGAGRLKAGERPRFRDLDL